MNRSRRPRLAVLLAALGALAAAQPLAAQEGEPPTAASLLDRHEQKVGGQKLRSGFKSLVVKGKLEVSGMPEGGSFEEIHLGRDRVKITTTWPGMGSMTMGATPEASWTTDPAIGIAIKEGDEQAPVRRMFAVPRMAPWRELFTSARTAGEETIGGRRLVGVDMVPEVGKPERWYLDPESGLLSRLRTSIPDPHGGAIAMDWVFEDWKPVQGVLLPHVRRQEIGPMKITFRCESIVIDGEVDPAAAEPPEAVLEAMRDPAKRTPALPEKGGECVIETRAAQPAAAIRVTIKPTEVSKTLAVLCPEVFAYVVETGAEMTGPLFTRYHRIDDDAIELEAGMPLRKPIAGKGRIKAIELPAGRAVVTWHIGPYQDLRKTYELVKEWMKANDARSRDAFWEIYWTDPGLEPDPAKWRTQIVWPIE